MHNSLIIISCASYKLSKMLQIKKHRRNTRVFLWYGWPDWVGPNIKNYMRQINKHISSYIKYIYIYIFFKFQYILVSWTILSSMRSCSWCHHSSLKGSPRHLESLFLFLAVSVCAGLYILAWRGQRSAYVGHLLYPVRSSRAYRKLLHIDSQSNPISYNVNESGHQPIPKPVLWVFELLCRNKEHFQLLFTLSNIELHLIFNKRVSTTWKIKIASPTQFLCQYWNFDIITWTFDSWKAFFHW